MARDDRGFYVGYLDAPAAHARFVKRVILALMWLCVMVAGVSAWVMRSPGDGVWDSSTPRMFEGVIRETPYPMLETEEGAYLLVRIGKRGAQDRVHGLEGHRVWAEGYLLERDGRRMIEVLDDAGAIREVTGDLERADAFTDLGEVAVRGEIVDSKCYLGAMKPGDGKGHKACAALCVGNGIPPLLVVHREGGEKDYYIVVTDAFGAAHEMMRPYLGEAVEVHGRVIERGGVLFIAAEGVSRL